MSLTRNLGTFADQMRFPKKLLESAGIPGSYEKMPANASMEQMHSTLSVEGALKLGSIRTHRNTTLESLIPDLDTTKREERIADTCRRRLFW